MSLLRAVGTGSLCLHMYPSSGSTKRWRNEACPGPPTTKKTPRAFEICSVELMAGERDIESPQSGMYRKNSSQPSRDLSPETFKVGFGWTSKKRRNIVTCGGAESLELGISANAGNRVRSPSIHQIPGRTKVLRNTWQNRPTRSTEPT